MDATFSSYWTNVAKSSITVWHAMSTCSLQWYRWVEQSSLSVWQLVLELQAARRAFVTYILSRPRLLTEIRTPGGRWSLLPHLFPNIQLLLTPSIRIMYVYLDNIGSATDILYISTCYSHKKVGHSTPRAGQSFPIPRETCSRQMPPDICPSTDQSASP